MKILYLPNQYSQQRQREKKRWIYPVLMAMEAQYHVNRGNIVYWGSPPHIGPVNKIITKPEGISFLKLPHPDRYFTNAFDKKYQQNGNFKYHPATYIQVANGCWHGKCTFCVEQKNKWEVRSVDDVIDEIEECIAMGFKEVFDDSGTFPIGGWLDDFVEKIRPLNIRFGCNMRLVDIDYVSLRRSDFRMLLFGLESANQETLDRINKGVKVEDVKYIIKAAEAGLDCHVAVMFGYPWETDEDAMKTLKLVWWLLKKGYAKTAQASLIMPGGKESQHHFCKKIYNIAYSPQFWLNKIRDLHDWHDLKYLWRQIKEGIRRA